MSKLHMSYLGVVALAALCIALVPGCPGQGVPCGGLCDENEICVNDQCVPKECTNDEDCPEGEVCSNGVCEPAQTDECATDEDCPEGEVCSNGVCEQVASPECETDEDCGEGEVCSNGACEAAPIDECATDEDCPEGQVCTEGECVEDGGNGGGDATAGATLYGNTCSGCHGDQAQGGFGPTLLGFDAAALEAGIAANPGFHAFELTDAQYEDLAAYLATLGG